jgi:YD repeat-containing protein
MDSDNGFHQIRRRYSPDGQVVEERGFGPGGADDPIIGADGYHQRITEFDRGIEVSRAHYGPERAEVLGRDRKAPCHRVEREIDDRGRIEAETCIGIDGPGAFSSGVARIERDHDTAGRQTATRATRLDGTPDVERNGTHRTTWTYDDQSRTVTERHFGIEDQPVDVRDLGYSIKTIEDDTLGREVARSYRTAAGEPARALNLASAIHDIEPGERVYSEYRVQRGAAGRVESAELVPADPSTTDPISIRFTHDAVGNPTSARLRGPDGSLVAVGGVAGWDREWHATGREIRQTWVGVDETPVNGPDGCAIIARELDDSGRDATVQITDQQGMELPSCGRTEAGTYSHDARGRVTQTCRAGRGCRVQTFDDRGNVIRIRYEDADGQLITSWKGGAAQVDLEYDAWDRQVRLRFFDRIGNPVVHDPVGAAEWTQTYDRAGRRFETRFLDRRGQPMKGPGGCAVERRTYGTDGVEVLACEPG